MYELIKVTHVCVATLILGLLCALIYLRILSQHRFKLLVNDHASLERTLSWAVITPCFFIQLLLGFAMISLKQWSYSSPWALSIFIGFGVSTLFWVLSLYFLSQETIQPKAIRFKNSCQRLCVLSLCFMLLFMVNPPLVHP
jgi:uncharacterized membrane protein